ncbi:excinuclease ABC subunit UvrC [Dichotomicrobium thermohalophilum]|uniref:UvrABC system protein C n=1 Tax=Dichotomicrobium thermohalophilum TaxID=933063 RepID=A0A397PJJ1_9HYPH|nr:excinuclease ABC subunit UvrC [Dichotomicrobium thermohalophilum]RIA47445.1 excinuclease ABC subunit C [Dichotomicrobium thermohalophilum]
MPKADKPTLPSAETLRAPAAAQSAPPADAPARPATGPDVIAGYLPHLSGSPGVYRMIGADGEVLYVGKARNLKKRVSSYARGGGHNNRITSMIAQTAAMEFVTTATESEALLLEANLIKIHRPRFNVLMRDDKSFANILIARDHEAPQLRKHRGARTRKGDYFGPFASAGAVNRTIHTLQRAFLLRTCTDSVYESRTRPCLLYQIKRCAGPCTGEISLADYNKLADEAAAFLRGEGSRVRDELQQKMEAASAELDFERAAIYRDRLAALAQITARQDINLDGIEDADIFAAAQEGGQTCVQVFFFRGGQNWGNRANFPRADQQQTVEEVLSAFIAQFYDAQPAPPTVLVSHDLPERELLSEALSLKAERKVRVHAPKRGEKRAAVEHAQRNAREALGRRLAESASQARLLEGLVDAFGLQDAPRRIEVYDNSHIQGGQAVGGMIVAGREGFVKSHYRKFNIKAADLTPGDDFGMMREVLRRRFTRLMKEAARAPDAPAAGSLRDARDDEEVGHTPSLRGPQARSNPAPDDADPDAFPAWPDLVLIDGGQGQLSAASEVFAELGINDVPLVAVAKGPERNAGRERFFMPGRSPFSLEPRDPVLYFIQRLRDEAHRFAIGAHRTRRKNANVANPLDEIAGIGPTRKRALLNHFGSAKAVSRAGLDDLAAVPGISRSMAEAIYNHFHDK